MIETPLCSIFLSRSFMLERGRRRLHLRHNDTRGVPHVQGTDPLTCRPMIASVQGYMHADPRRLMRSLFVLAFLLIQVIVVAVWLWPRRRAFGHGWRELWSDFRAALRAEPAPAKVAVIALTLVGLATRAYYLTCPMRGDEAGTY